MILIAWDDTKIKKDDFLSADWNVMVPIIKAKSTASNGAGVPSSTPANIGDIYVDTTTEKIYMATGTSSASDWKKLVSQ